MSWVAAAVGVGTLAYGIYQKDQGKKDAKKGERKLAIEASKKNELAEEKQRRLELGAAMSGEMPGETKRKNDIGASTSKRITAAKEASTTSANQQSAIAQSVLDQQDEYGKIAAETEQFKEDKRTAAIEGLGDMADARSIDIGIAEAQIAKGEAQKGAGQQNINQGAVSTATTMGTAGSSGGGGSYRRRGKSPSEKQYDIDKKAAEKEAKRNKRNRRGNRG